MFFLPALHFAVIFTERLFVTVIFCNHNLRPSFVLILYVNRFPLSTLLSWVLSCPLGGLVLSHGKNIGGVAQGLTCDGGREQVKKRRWGEGTGKATSCHSAWCPSRPGLVGQRIDQPNHWTGSHFSMAPLTPPVAAREAMGWAGTWVPSAGAWLTGWPLEAAWGQQQGPTSLLGPE